jgi:hypothetical protein
MNTSLVPPAGGARQLHQRSLGARAQFLLGLMIYPESCLLYCHAGVIGRSNSRLAVVTYRPPELTRINSRLSPDPQADRGPEQFGDRYRRISITSPCLLDGHWCISRENRSPRLTIGKYGFHCFEWGQCERDALQEPCAPQYTGTHRGRAARS